MEELAQGDNVSRVQPVIQEESAVVLTTIHTIDNESTAHSTDISSDKLKETEEDIRSVTLGTAHSTDISSDKLKETEEDIRSVTLGENERNTAEQEPSSIDNDTGVISLIQQSENNDPQNGFTLTPKKGASKTNPFAYDSDSDNLVAICCAELSCEEGKQEETDTDGNRNGDDMSDEGNSHTWRTSLPMRYNPFDVEGEIKDADDIETLTRQQQSDESSVPFTLSNISRFRHHITTPSSSSSTKSIHTFSKKYAQEIHDLQLWGFDYALCTNALMHMHGNVDKAKQLLITHLLDDHPLVSNVQSWTSPVMVRVGGWLPNIQGEIGTDIHTEYFISVTMTLGNESWRVGHRYNEFWNLYCAVYPRICQAMPQGMKNVFPADRLSSWLGHTFGVNMEGFNDNRMKLLDAWLKELCNNSLIMLDEDARTIVYDFLQVNGNLARLHRFRQSISGTRGNISSNNSSSSSNSNSNHVFSSSSSSGSKPTSFHSHSSTDAIPRTTTTTPSWPNSSLCCTFSVSSMKTTHDMDGLVTRGMGTPIQHGTPMVENQHHLEADMMNSPDMVALINRRKAAKAAQQNDDSAARGHDHGAATTIRTRREPNTG